MATEIGPAPAVWRTDTCPGRPHHRHLIRIATTTAKDEEMTRMRVTLQRLLDDQRQAIEAFAHVGMPGRQPARDILEGWGSRPQGLQGRRHQRRRRPGANANASLVQLHRDDRGFTDASRWRLRRSRRRGLDDDRGELNALGRPARLAPPLVDKACANILPARDLRHDRARRRISANIRARSSSLQCRRRSRPEIKVTWPMLCN